jgi:hypothetical protein
MVKTPTEPTGTGFSSAIIAVGNVRLVTFWSLEFRPGGRRRLAVSRDATPARGNRDWRKRNMRPRTFRQRVASAMPGTPIAPDRAALSPNIFPSPGLHADHVSLRILSAAPASPPLRGATPADRLPANSASLPVSSTSVGFGLQFFLSLFGIVQRAS